MVRGSSDMGESIRYLPSGQNRVRACARSDKVRNIHDYGRYGFHEMPSHLSRTIFRLSLPKSIAYQEIQFVLQVGKMFRKRHIETEREGRRSNLWKGKHYPACTASPRDMAVLPGRRGTGDHSSMGASGSLCYHRLILATIWARTE
jgi:hypothetical protein